MKTTIVFLLAGTLFTANTNAQDTSKTAAENAYNNKNWQAAETYYQQYLATNVSDTLAVYHLAMAQLKQSKYKEALNNFRDISELELPGWFINELRFEQAKIYAAINDTSKCLQFLEMAALNGADFNGRLSDSLFNTVRSQSRFSAIIEKCKENETPCLYDDRYKQLDFFIGTWNVYTGDNYNEKVAVDTVSKFDGGCSIDEKFRWLGGDYVGESMSFYDNTSQRFRMCWAGKSGDIRNFEAIYTSKDSIVFLAVTNTNSLRQLLHRKLTISYNPADETLHEYIENSYDLGKTWEPEFDALFKKAKR
ncbi:MAG: hypothetical protein ABJA35_16445 [Parafilimonas sp.]